MLREMKGTGIIHEDFYTAVSNEPPEIKVQWYDAIFEFVFYNREPKDLPECLKLLWNMARARMQRDKDEYSRQCEKRRQAANKRWSKTKNIGQEEMQDNAIDTIDASAYNSNNSSKSIQMIQVRYDHDNDHELLFNNNNNDNNIVVADEKRACVRVREAGEVVEGKDREYLQGIIQRGTQWREHARRTLKVYSDDEFDELIPLFIDEWQAQGGASHTSEADMKAHFVSMMRIKLENKRKEERRNAASRTSGQAMADKRREDITNYVLSGVSQ